MDTNTFNTTALQDELTGALVGLARRRIPPLR